MFWLLSPTLVAIFHFRVPQFTKHSWNFLLSLCLKSASENSLFGGPFGGLDDQYPSIPKSNGIPYFTQERTKWRDRAKW